MKNHSRFFIIGIAIIFFIIISSFGGFVKFSTDYLWFKELGYIQTFLTKLKSQFFIGIPVFILLTFLLYIYINKLKKRFYEETQIIDTQNNKKINIIIKAISSLISLFITVNITSTLWFEILQYLNSESFNVIDPVFGNDIGFYIFKLPLINTIISFIINILFMLIIVTVLFYGFLAIRKSIKNISDNMEEMTSFNTGNFFDLNLILNKKFATKIINQISIIGALIFIFMGIRYFLRTYDLLYSRLGRVFGAGFTDMNITLNLYRILAIGFVIS